MTNAALRRLLAQRALSNAEEFAPEVRADAYEIVALMLTERDADEARMNAFTIRQAMKQQALFDDLLASPPPKKPGGDGDGAGPYPPPSASDYADPS